MYGASDSHTVSNTKSGRPLDKNGHPLVTGDGSPDVRAQPPCFLRYSPQVFEHEASDMFVHEVDTNRLKLRRPEAGSYPWMRERPDEWLCDFYFPLGSNTGLFEFLCAHVIAHLRGIVWIVGRGASLLGMGGAISFLTATRPASAISEPAGVH